MKKIILLACFPFMANAQISDTSGVNWIKTEHDFGQVKFDIPVTHKFKFVNKSKRAIEIVSVEASCGCTQPVWTTSPILPNDTAFVEATFNARTEGVFNKQVSIYTNKSPYPTKLILKGEVIKNP
jgi:hypothetical protein